MANNVLMNFLKKLRGFAIFIEAGFLSFINYIIFGDHERIINFFSSNIVTDNIAILTILLLSLGFIYYIGYFLGAKLMKVDLKLKGGGSLSELILPYGAIFILAIFIFPLIIHFSKPELSYFRIFIINTFGFVFIFGFINEVFDQFLRKQEEIQSDKQGKEKNGYDLYKVLK